jgi:hypothetical protein
MTDRSYYEGKARSIAARKAWTTEVAHPARWFFAVVEPVGAEGWRVRPMTEDPEERGNFDAVVAAVGIDAARRAMVESAESDMGMAAGLSVQAKVSATLKGGG